MHYHRKYRHGDVHATSTAAPRIFERRYRRIYRPQHPLANRNGGVYVHRAVLYDRIGPGPHACHWCATTVHWRRPRGAADALHVDHLNRDGADNHPSNLVPSCPRCNSLRGSQTKHDALVSLGFWSHHDTVARTGAGRQPVVTPAQSA